MTRPEFEAILGPLVLAKRADFDLPTWTVYYLALQDVSAVLLADAVSRAVRSPSAFLPHPGELRALAETSRLALLAAHPYTGCAECEGSIGWIRTLEQRPNQPREILVVVRCQCHAQYQASLAAMGCTVLALTEARADA